LFLLPIPFKQFGQKVCIDSNNIILINSLAFLGILMKMNQQQQILRRNNSPVAEADNNNNNDSDTEAAASALTALGASISQHKPEEDRNGEDDGGVDIEIPQRFTKSGRKRAVSFPLKVRQKQTTFFMF
jgi:hypothetical protein